MSEFDCCVTDLDEECAKCKYAEKSAFSEPCVKCGFDYSCFERAEKVLAETGLQEMKVRPNRPTSYSGRVVKFEGDMHLPSPEEYNEMNDRRQSTMGQVKRKDDGSGSV